MSRNEADKLIWEVARMLQRLRCILSLEDSCHCMNRQMEYNSLGPRLDDCVAVNFVIVHDESFVIRKNLLFSPNLSVP